MIRSQRLLALTLAVATVAMACKKKAAVTPTPVSTAAAPTETCNRACQDSIARADAARRAAEEAARNRDASAARDRAKAAAVAALTAKIYFDYDMAELSGEARSALDSKIPVMRANPAIRIRISGHADERGSDEYNLALGQRRAAVAKRYLTDQGIDPARIETVSYGEQRPAADGHEEASYRQNRRAEFEITAGSDSIVGTPDR